MEALHDFATAIELNDNRGVYRSQLLLDRTSQHVAPTSQGIYDDLGFSSGRVEAWTSVTAIR